MYKFLSWAFNLNFRPFNQYVYVSRNLEGEDLYKIKKVKYKVVKFLNQNNEIIDIKILVVKFGCMSYKLEENGNIRYLTILIGLPRTFDFWSSGKWYWVNKSKRCEQALKED